MKGSIQDLIMAAVIVFGFSLIVFISHRILLGFQGTSLDDYGTVTDFISRSAIFDVAVALLGIFVLLVILAKAWEVRTNPIFFPIAVIVGGFAIVLAAQLANVFNTISTNSEFTATAAYYPITTNLNLNLPLYILAGLLLLLGVLYARGRASSSTRF